MLHINNIGLNLYLHARHQSLIWLINIFTLHTKFLIYKAIRPILKKVTLIRTLSSHSTINFLSPLVLICFVEGGGQKQRNKKLRGRGDLSRGSHKLHTSTLRFQDNQNLEDFSPNDPDITASSRNWPSGFWKIRGGIERGEVLEWEPSACDVYAWFLRALPLFQLAVVPSVFQY